MSPKNIFFGTVLRAVFSASAMGFCVMCRSVMVCGSADLQIIAERRASANFTHVASADQQKPVF
jgi:hypothetical protein